METADTKELALDSKLKRLLTADTMDTKNTKVTTEKMNCTEIFRGHRKSKMMNSWLFIVSVVPVVFIVVAV